MELLTDLTARLGLFLESYGLLAIFAVMLLKEFGVPVPVPSDLIMITAGVQAAAGGFTLIELLVAILLAMSLGGSAQFLIARKAGRRFVAGAGRIIGLTEARLDHALDFLRGRGTTAVFLGLNIPGARAGIIPAAGIVGLGYPGFLVSMVAGSTIFYAWHIALGFVFGPSAEAILERLNLPALPVLLGLAGLGLIGWLLLRGRRKTAAPERRLVDRAHSWTEAACPACLTITALQQLRSSSEIPGEA